MSLPAIDKGRLGVEILATYVRVRWAMRRSDVTAVVADLRSPQQSSRQMVLGRPADASRLGAAVIRTLQLFPFDSRCLMRSLVLLRLLARRGLVGSLVIAVRPDEVGLAAHAWIESDGRALLPPAAPDHGRLVTL